ncbi:hypothetical protein [Dechloromonas sp. HYN0024]|uniref:hypothetical protein n=1 Tax=Dechloromonas sp. HYN0024 TaxID=2231055 RepID=UPI000E44C029|nr:hypothetical protein [Dechloromonas sp. HYN0024]AXS79845.1 hypothetical protein HYN24_07340 [Dechloromonas sp. HYN0024]
MNKYSKSLVVSFWVSIATLASSAQAWSADTPLETEQIKQQTMAIPGIQRDVAKATGNDAKMIDITTTPHKLTITVINSKLNDAQKADRESEASTMASAVARAVSGKAPFAQVIVIHVDYVKRVGNKDEAIQRLDFNKSPAGIFVAHQS